MTARGPLITDRYGLLTRDRAASQGVSTSTLETGTRSGRLVRPYRGVYAVPDTGDEHQQVRSALAHLGVAAVGVIGSAAIAHGLQGLPRSWRPQVAMPPGLERAQRRDLEIHVWDLPAEHVTSVDDLPVTTIVRTLADVCRLLPRERAVCLVDSALDQRLVTPGDLDVVRDLMARRRNCVPGRRHLNLARVGAQSPGETRVRLILTDAGLPPDALQIELRHASGGLIGYGDLGYHLPDGGILVVEFDGRSVHEAPAALLADRSRQNAILAAPNATILRFAWEDTRSPHTIVSAVAPVLRQARWRPGRSGSSRS